MCRYIHAASVRAGFVKERKSTDSTGTYPKLCPGGFANRCRKSEAGGSPETTGKNDTVTTGASNDIEKATKTARDMVTKYGMTKELGCICYGKDNSAVFLGRDMGHTQDYSEQTAAKIDELILEIVNNAYDRAETILKDNIDKLHEVAAYLIKHEKMGGEDFEAVMNGTYVEPVEAEDAESEEDNANTAENKDNE